jgi:hypothetical protein
MVHSMEALLQKRRGAQQLVPPSRTAPLRLRTDGPAAREPRDESSHPSSAQGPLTSTSASPNPHARRSMPAELAADAVPVTQVRCAGGSAPSIRFHGLLVHTLRTSKALVLRTEACCIQGCVVLCWWRLPADGHAHSSLLFCRRRRRQARHARTWHRPAPGWRRRRALEGCTATRRRYGRRRRRPARRAIRHCWMFACRTPRR